MIDYFSMTARSACVRGPLAVIISGGLEVLAVVSLVRYPSVRPFLTLVSALPSYAIGRPELN